MFLPSRLKAALTRIRNVFYTLRDHLAFRRSHLLFILFWPVLSILIVAISWHLLFLTLNEEKHNAEAFALEEVNALATSYADNLKRNIDAIDQLLLLVRLEWETTHGKLALEQLKYKGIFPSSKPFNVSITDRNGQRLTSTYDPSYDALNVSMENQASFLVHQSSVADDLYISPPIIERVSGNEVIQFSRRLSDQHGNFDGIVFISVQTNYFIASYDEKVIGQHGLIGMMGNDKVMRVARLGNTVLSINFSLLIQPLEFNPSDHSVFLNGTSFSDQRSRFIAWRAIDGYPFVAIAGLDEQEKMASYRARHTSLISTAIIASICLAILTLIAMVFSIRLARRSKQLEHTQAAYRIATESGDEGFYIATPIKDRYGSIVDVTAVDCNQRGAEFFSVPRDQFIGNPLSHLYRKINFPNTLDLLIEAFKHGESDGEFTIFDNVREQTRHMHLKAKCYEDKLAVTINDITEHKTHMLQLEKRSNEDPLTGLPNRQWVQDYLPKVIEQASANNTLFAILYIDLDGFKKVNDTLGHAAGDEVLHNAARRLKLAVRPHDHVVRLGGDEFVVILESIVHDVDAAHIADRILHAFQEKFRLSKGIQSVGASIGIAIYPNDAQDAQTLLQNADMALYSVKSHGKRHYRFYNQKFSESLRRRHQREEELRHAIEHDQFIMHYQPRMDLTTSDITSMEALVRWVHPTIGLLEPLEFVPLAEETGLIVGLGELVIDKVCAQLARWKSTQEKMLPVSINVSPRQFNDANTNITKVLSRALIKHNIPAHLIEIELTESAMLENPNDAAITVSNIRNMGIKLLVDDFGTGYSSLSQLRTFNFDLLKVDRAFTEELDGSPEHNVFFTAIITMAHALGMRVVAEGVENETQIRILKALHCDEVQGFYISHPVSGSYRQAAFSL
jgi:diguanylate cyclase (GGDEF)-like protein